MDTMTLDMLNIDTENSIARRQMPCGRRRLVALACRILLTTTLACVPASLLAQSQSWDQKIDAQNRFKVLKAFNDEAVLDQETGLVWEKTPEPSSGGWAFIDDECFAHFTGGRLGWRPPTLEEMLSLMDPLQNDMGKLPSGHPFDLGATRGVTRDFWTLSTAIVQPANNSFAYVANFEPGGSFFPDPKISATHRFWCVRGGHGYDGNNVP
jgi:hypothetical protein